MTIDITKAGPASVRLCDRRLVELRVDVLYLYIVPVNRKCGFCSGFIGAPVRRLVFEFLVLAGAALTERASKGRRVPAPALLAMAGDKQTVRHHQRKIQEELECPAEKSEGTRNE